MISREEIFEFSKKVLQVLQSLGFFEGKPPMVEGFDVELSDGAELADRNYRSAFSVASNGVPVIVVKKDFSLCEPDDLYGLIHETIHIAQVMKGDYVCSFNKQVLWKGGIYKSLDGLHPDYFDERLQPWEAEAEEMVPLVFAQLGK